MTKQKLKNDICLKNIMSKIHELENKLSLKSEPGTELSAASNFSVTGAHNQPGPPPMLQPPIRPPMSLVHGKAFKDSINSPRVQSLAIRSPNSVQGQRPRFSAPNTTNNLSFQNPTQPSGNRQRFNSFRQRHPAPNQGNTGARFPPGNNFSDKTTNSRYSELDNSFSSHDNFPNESYFEEDNYENKLDFTEDFSNYNYTVSWKK